MHSTPDRFLMLLKMRGPQPASLFAKEFGMTGEGARLHLVKLMEAGLVKAESVSKGVGRPSINYSLTDTGFAQFPDTHAELTVQLLETVRLTLGDAALDTLIASRETATDMRYSKEMKGLETIEDKLNTLARLRSAEGYMAEWKKESDGYLFIENHCPICAAAVQCQSFCEAELNNLRKIFGTNTVIERTDHIVAGARRCAYRIRC